MVDDYAGLNRRRRIWTLVTMIGLILMYAGTHACSISGRELSHASDLRKQAVNPAVGDALTYARIPQ